MDYVRLCKESSKVIKGRVAEKQADNLKRSIDFLGWDVAPEDTQSLAKLIGVICIPAGTSLVIFSSIFLGFSFLWFLFVMLPAVFYLYLGRYPVLKAGDEKRKAISQMPEVVGYLIMSLRINPNIETAIVFASKHSKGLFKAKLDGIIQDIRLGRGSADSGLRKLSAEFPKCSEFGGSLGLIISSTTEKTEDSRQKTLDKASDILLGGLASRTEREARALNTPVMVVFTFGVILPLIFIAIIPFISLMGIKVGSVSIALLYTIGLPLLLYIMIRFIVSNRPATVSPPQIPARGKDIGALLIALGVGLGFSLALLLGKSAFGEMEYVPLLWGFCAGSGVFLIMTVLVQKKERRNIKVLEDSFGEGLHQLSTLLSEGHPLEAAIDRANASFFKKAASNIRLFNKGLKAAFFDNETGALKEVPSETIRGAIDIITSIADKGSENMARIGFKLSEHISNMKKCEESIERSLGSVVSSMKIIAMVVAPLVGGMISSMSAVLADTVAQSQQAEMSLGSNVGVIDPSLITLIIGIYAVESAIILVVFGTELLHGNDKVMKRFNVGIAVIVSVIVFTACTWLANGLFGGIA